jgi:predicted nucleotidyltransferase
MMDKNEVLTKVKQFSELVVKKYNPEKIILFGSYANGNYHDNSDIDIAVLVDNLEGDFLDHEAGLYKLRRNIDLSIEPVLFTNRIDKSGFLDSILSYGEIVYQRQ